MTSIDDIRYGRIYSSTETLFAALEILGEAVEHSESVQGLVANVKEIGPKLLEARPTSALLWNMIRSILTELKESMKREAQLEGVRCRVADR